MKKVLSLALVLCMMLAFVPSVQATRVMDMVLDGEWDFKYYQNANEVPNDVTKIVFEDKIQVPGAMEMQGYGYPAYYYEEQGGWGMPEDDGVRSAGVYKKEFVIENSSEVEYKYIRFENVTDDLVVYVDGEKIGESRNGAIGTVFEVELGKGKHTIICVVKRDKSGINKADDFSLSGIMGYVCVSQKKTHIRYIPGENKDVKYENNKLYIDGKEVVLKGVRYTATHPETGNALSEEQIEKDLEIIKEYGFNCVWTSCAPDYFYYMAGYYGLYVIDEANVNLDSADRDMETAKARVNEMVEKHKECLYNPIIMWSVGSGDASRAGWLVDVVKKLDYRPVAQEVNFAPDFEVFGNTGGMRAWVDTLGDGNVGGFVDEFADKELYFTRNVYVFDAHDSVTGETVTIDGEIKNFNGKNMLGKAGYVREVETLKDFTVLAYISNANKDRVIFETADKRMRLETVDYRIRLTVDGRSIDADGGEGKVAAVYTDGEMQLFTSQSIKSNMECEISLTNAYSVGEGDGGVAIEYVKIYNDALTIDELIELSAEDKLVSSVEFENVEIKEDKSYKFLAYGGDFGDATNSYYKCLTGIFSSTREPHPEAEAFKAIFANVNDATTAQWGNMPAATLVTPVLSGNEAVWTTEKARIVVTSDGRITSIKDEKGVELLSEAMYPTVVRENTISETEMGLWQEEGWRTKSFTVSEDVLYVELLSTVTDGRLLLAFKVDSEGNMLVSMQSQFADDAAKPSFVGFRGVSEVDTAAWVGKGKASSYPDRREGEVDLYEMKVSDMDDGYAVPQENGNRHAYAVALYSKNESSEKGLAFSVANSSSNLEFCVHDYSPEAMYDADHDEDIEKGDKAYFRVGGYIKGVSGDRSYELSENCYGFDFYILPANLEIDTPAEFSGVRAIYVDGKKLDAFATGVKTYVYQTNEAVTVTAEGGEVIKDENKAVIGDYRVYFAPEDVYLSDMEAVSEEGSVSRDMYFDGSGFTMRGNYWEASQAYDKGVALKSGSKLTYDISKLDNHTFSTVIGKQDFDWRKMGGGFNRNMFDASATVTFYLDGVEVEKVQNISMRSERQNVSFDVSGAKELVIEVTGSNIAPDYEDAVLGNAAFVPKGPIVINLEKSEGKARITVLNTDRDYVDVVLTSTENNVVTTESTHIGKGLYRTIEVKSGDDAYVKAYVTGLGELVLSE